jgi:hypothetical protein
MRAKAPRVPPAVQLADAGTQGPLVLPGTYTVRMTRGGETYEAKLPVELDRRATYTLADRKDQYDAAMRIAALFAEESALMGRIQALRGELAERGNVTTDATLKKRITDFDGKVDVVRKRIVATTEGGAITGEERLREETDKVYGAVLSYDGAPTAYQLERIDVLQAEFNDIDAQFGALMKQELPALNTALATGGLRAIDVPAEVAATADSDVGSGSGQLNGIDEDAGALAQGLPREMVIYR